MHAILMRINRAFAMLCGWLMLLLMILLVMDFVGRGIPNAVNALGVFLNSPALSELSTASWMQPMTFLADLSVFFMIIAVYLGLALCEENKQHVHIEIVTSRLTGRTQRVVKVVAYLLQSIIICIMVYAFYKNIIRSYNINEAVSGMVPLIVWPVKACAFVGLVLYWIQVLVSSYEAFRDLFTFKTAD